MQTNSVLFVLVLVTAAVLSTTGFAQVCAAEFEVVEFEGGVAVNVDGELFTKYLIKSGNKPIMWPLLGPSGVEMTRAYPMEDARPGEEADHPHHRSFWFTHGDVNGISFWAENENAGHVVHREFVKAEGGHQAVIVTRNDWVSESGEKQCEDERRFVFGADEDQRWINAELIVKATAGDVKFGDTKEGCFGVRVAGTMKVTSEQGGRLVNAEDVANTDAWGKASPWVDYHGPVDGQQVGIAIMNHPSSFRYPTYWHVRTYGLFVANPFGLHNFKNSNDVDGSHVLPAGESFTLRYRILLHDGDTKQGGVADDFKAYAAQDLGGE